MGVEHYLVCKQCKEYVDIGKSYAFNSCLNDSRDTAPKNIVLNVDYGTKTSLNNQMTIKGIWFLWKHRGHKGIYATSDHCDEWWNEEPYLKEVDK